jgi:hypothetical protein
MHVWVKHGLPLDTSRPKDPGMDTVSLPAPSPVAAPGAMTAGMTTTAAAARLRPVPVVAEEVIGERPTAHTVGRWVRQGLVAVRGLSRVWLCTEGEFRSWLARRSAKAVAQ